MHQWQCYSHSENPNTTIMGWLREAQQISLNISEKTLARVTNLPVLYHMNDANDFPRGQSETGFLKFPEYLARLS